MSSRADRFQLANPARNSQLGQVPGAILHELNQPLTAILSIAGAGACTLKSVAPDRAEILEILSDSLEDDRRAAD